MKRKQQLPISDLPDSHQVLKQIKDEKAFYARKKGRSRGSNFCHFERQPPSVQTTSARNGNCVQLVLYFGQEGRVSLS
jgi:hypothetical protein